MRADVAYEICVCDLSTQRDLGLFDEENGSGAFDLGSERAFLADAMGKEATPFVGEATFPDWCIRTAQKRPNGALFSSGWGSSYQSSNVVSVRMAGGGLGEWAMGVAVR